MKIVIDIPEEVYKASQLINVTYDDVIQIPLECIAKGTPLPKEHGRLIDESDLMPDSDYEDGIFYAVSVGQINSAPTIIEADKVESERIRNE